MFKTAILLATALTLAGPSASASSLAPSGFGFEAHAVRTGRTDSLLPQEPDNLYPLSAQFGLLPTNYDGTDLWPCYGGASECSSINPDGVVVGIPKYGWSLSSCDNSSEPATPCGQGYFFYQDQTNDSTDDLIVTVTVKQGNNYIFAAGPLNKGPNPFAGETVVFSGDIAFGTQGQAGKGNGWCADTKRTCVNPVAGPANFEAVVQVGSYVMKQKFTFYLQ
jgi:hypothetical protein